MICYRITTDELNELQIASLERLCRLTEHGAHNADITVRKDGINYHFEADWIYTAKIERIEKEDMPLSGTALSGSWQIGTLTGELASMHRAFLGVRPDINPVTDPPRPFLIWPAG